MTVFRNANGIAGEVDAPSGAATDGFSAPDLGSPVVLIHAGVCDRRMWDPQWPALVEWHRAIRLDLRGFGESTERPAGTFAHHRDVIAALDEVGIRDAHLVGVSLGAGIATELAITRPDLVASLFLVAPGGALRTEPSEELEAFWEAEEAALEAGDLDAAVEANLRTWVDGPYRQPGQVDPTVRALVGEMQRRAFEVTDAWGEVDEEWLDPRAGTRLAEVGQPTLVLVGDGDLPVVGQTAERVATDVPGARLVRWPVVAHLLSMERPDDFTRLLLDWVADPSIAGE